METRATALRTCANNRLINRTLNGFGYLARNFYSDYAVGKSRSLAELQPRLEPGVLEIRPEGIFLNRSQKLSANGFLIESLLRKNITTVDIKQRPTYQELAQLGRGKLRSTDSLAIHENPGQAERLLPEVERTNQQKLMKWNALTALFAGVSYAVYKTAALILALDTFKVVDTCASVFLTSFTIICAGINILKQKFVADSVKYREPNITEAEKKSVQGATGPKVSVLIPACNEPVEVLRKTLQAAEKLDYTNFEVVLLLDSRPDSQNFKDVMTLYETEFAAGGRVKVFARKKYADVANQKLNKADNINAFINFAHGRNIAGQNYIGSEIILITDADYRLKPEFLLETVPLLIVDENIAYVMTPQNFALDQGNSVEQANAALMSTSWQQINKGSAHSARVLFGGCNSIIRVSTLKEVSVTRSTGEIDYLPTDTVTEDLALTLRFIEHGRSSVYVSKPLAEGNPIASLGDHFATFWRYSEGSIENTLKHTLPSFTSGKISAFSWEGLDYLSKGISPIATASLGLVALAPLLAYYGVELPHTTSLAALLYYLSLSKAAKATLKAQGVKDNWAHAKITALMYLHFPVHAHATYTALKNYLLGKEAHFRVTRKDGNRTRLPLGYLLPLIGTAGINAFTAAANFTSFISTFEPFYLETSLWSLLPLTAIGYGLVKFNGFKNTLSDFSFGLSFRKTRQ